MRNFAVHGDYRRDLAAATRPLTIIAGADDELMLADKYAEAVRGAPTPVDVKLIDGINHMGIVSAPKALSIVADDVATRGSAGQLKGDGNMVDSQQASEALAEIDAIVHRVRQSRIYDLASLMLIMWGALVFAGNIASFLWPRHAGYIWIAVNATGVAGSFAIGGFERARSRICSFDIRMFAALLLFFAFGYFCTSVLGHFPPRQMGTFWPVYFMLLYTIAGLWIGSAFVAIGVGITALTLVGYFLIGDAFDLWMAFVNGGGLMLGGLWMRRS